uniref:Myosin-2 heavy chain-like n=1 Tax=Sinocyclocheilus anshuiensis TaxID=1608454 RepID=A0A671QVG6_9TELE
MKIKCRDSYKIAKDNIDLLNILQKVIDLQEMDAVLITERDAAKIERLDKRRKEAESDLAEMKTGFSGSVEILERAVSKINAETLKSDKATSTPLNELKKYLEDKLKQPGEQGDTAKQVLQIVILQIEAMELKTRISGKFKTQAQMDVIISKLEYKNGLLSDLKEEREDRKEHIQKIDVLIAALEKEILDLNAELSALKQTLVQLDDGLDTKRIEIMDKIGKLKGKDEIISRILKLQFEFMEALITARGQMKADEFKINDAEAELEAQVNNVLDKTSKTALQIILLGFEINQITKQIKASSSNEDLKRLRDEKLKELKLKKEELQQSDASSEKILKVISQMEEIWKLQSEDPDNLNKITNLQKELMNLISKLDDKMASKPMLKIIALQSDVTWIREMLKTVTTEAEIQKAELQKALDDIKHLLNEKNKELAAATGDKSQLQKDIAALKKDVLRLQMEIDTSEGNAKQKIKDLQEKLKQSNEALDDANKSLKEKNATLSQQITKINNILDEVRTLKQQVQEKESLLKARIADLERSLTMKEEENAKMHAENEKLKKNCLDNAECPELQKKYIGTLSSICSYIIKSLIDEVQDLDEQIAQGFPELRLELEEKKRQLEEAKQKLQAEGSISDKTLDVLELLTDIGKLQENPTEDNSDKIRSKFKQIHFSQLNSLLDELQSSGEKGLGLALKIMSIKESMSKLRQAQEQMQQKYAKEVNGKSILNASISEDYLKKQLKKQENALAEKDLYLKEKNEMIDILEKQRDNMKSELEKVKNKNRDRSFEIFLRLIRSIFSSDLEKTLEAKKQELAKKDQELQEKDNEVATLQKQYADTKAELKEEKNKLNGVINENEKLRQNLIETQKQVVELQEWPKLDANTAHRRLVISQDEKEARTSLLPQPVPDTTERYDTAIAALGKDGYDSGKHYWEIGVNGKNCYVVGAARASAQRKGILTYGPSAGYWVILKNRASKLFAMADRKVQLNTDALSVIGVQLDFKNNKVTFYDVERKLEIFSFTGNVLQGKIHPYIETCSDTYLNEPSMILKQPQSTGWLKQ